MEAGTRREVGEEGEENLDAVLIFVLVRWQMALVPKKRQISTLYWNG